MVFLVGLMFQGTRNAASVFIAIQHNVTQNASDSSNVRALDVLYTNGWKDLCGIIFQMLCWVVVQAVIQEYVLDKINRKLHMSKTKTSKFNDSGNMLPVFIASVVVGIDLIMKENLIPKIQEMWTGYPHTEMSFMLKLFFLLQISYWIHMFPELYFMKARKEDIPEKLAHYSLYLAFISAAYVMNFTRIALVLLVVHFISQAVFHISRILHCAGKSEIAQHAFTLWSCLFVFARLITISLAILTFWFGLGRAEQATGGMASGNFNNPTIRLACLLAVVLMQAWMSWNFIMFQVKRYRERASIVQRKSRQEQKKKGKKEKKGKDDHETVQNGSPKAGIKED